MSPKRSIPAMQKVKITSIKSRQTLIILLNAKYSVLISIYNSLLVLSIRSNLATRTILKAVKFTVVRDS
jgi:hypothetical protein